MRYSPELFCVSSGPVTLHIRPLSPYQRTLIDTILELRNAGWNDYQIAKYFNDKGISHQEGSDLKDSMYYKTI